MKLYCVDLFSGCGGIALGLERAGFKPLLFSEINDHAAASYQVNRTKEVLRIKDVAELTNVRIAALREEWREKHGLDRLDLITGGPPCQGYSGIGHRRTFKLDKAAIPSNQLFKEMVRVIEAFQPKVFLFENVQGLLTSSWTMDGSGGSIFKDVVQTFRSLAQYEVRWQLVYASDYGVPQNRPRVLLVGISKDLGFNAPPAKPDGNTVIAPTAVADEFLPAPAGCEAPSVEEVLSDLVDPQFQYGGETNAYPRPPQNSLQRQLRLSRAGNELLRADQLTEHKYSNHQPRIRQKFRYMLEHEGRIPEKMRTKKFAQKVLPSRWGHAGPTITVTSMPDDYVHYCQARTLTVREWARLQTFPDWYLFEGPRTTGGRRRAGDPSKGVWERDVPRYTQIGNAIPVELAYRVGTHLAGILRRSRGGPA
jgi:DNA (cytosine-5)-methyltransferase 1